MRIIVILINITLLAVLAILGERIFKIWREFDQPLIVENEGIVVNPEPHSPVYERPRTSRSSIEDIVSHNLFREERKAYVKPKPKKRWVSRPVVPTPPRPAPKPMAPPEPSTPAPELRLEGVVVIPGNNIAIMAGSYSVRQNGNNFKKVPLKNKTFGYGDYIGEYRIASIEKDNVTLRNQKGEMLRIELETEKKSGSKLKGKK